MLIILMQSKGPVEYKQLGKNLGVKNYTNTMTNENPLLRRDTQSIRRELGRLLKKTGMDLNDINQLIKPIKKVGYKIIDHTPT